MPSAEQVLASSSGVAAPSRKLKAERACNSTYISRIPRAQTIFPAGSRNKNDTRSCGKACFGRHFEEPACAGRRSGEESLFFLNCRAKQIPRYAQNDECRVCLGNLKSCAW